VRFGVVAERFVLLSFRRGIVPSKEGRRGVEVLSWALEEDLGVGALRGDLRGVLKGERKGFESVWEAASIRRRLAAGVDILSVLAL
jgi:hypothetical protein